MSGPNGAPVLPPIDPGNTFVLQRPLPDVLALVDDVVPYSGAVLVVTMTQDVDAPVDPVWQTAVPGTMGDGTRVLVITWRVGPGTLTARLTREDTVRLGRALIAAAGPGASLVITGPTAILQERAVEVRVELDGCAVRMRWARKDCEALGRALVANAQQASGLVVPAPGIHP